MYWADRLVAETSGPQVINDSKTPSGRVHVGALRGVVIHDAAARALRRAGRPVTFLYGFDDFDPMDELPRDLPAEFRQHMGKPLCDVPAPEGQAANYAEYFAGEFVGVITEIGARPRYYRTSELYRAGRFNGAIDRILSHADRVREIYRRVSGSQRTEEWLPFQAVCPRCGKIGTTRAYDYDGSTVAFVCEPHWVKWAEGCGASGRVSPFDGGGKLPWKMEWAAKWSIFGVTVEGAGKDHSSAGGARDVASAVYAEVFGGTPPLNIPYEFFLVRGQKMSSSKSIGASSREMADTLPPELLRFLMLRVRPQSAIDFDPGGMTIPRLYDEYDRFLAAYADPAADPDQKRVVELSQPDEDCPPRVYFRPPFAVVAFLVQLPHVELEALMTRQKGAPLDDDERAELARRAEYARRWLARYAPEEARVEIKAELPEAARELTAEQRAYCAALADALALPTQEWSGKALEATLYAVAQRLALPSREAFGALYRAFLGRPSGPRAGWLLASQAREWVVARLREAANPAPAAV